MAQDILAIIGGVPSLGKLDTLERNVQAKGAGTPEIEQALQDKYAEFGRIMVEQKTGLDLADLSSAEKRIVNAIGRYVALQKRDGKNAEYTFRILRNRGLIDAAEVSVARSKVTQGFETLNQAEMRALSFEQIIVDNPEEFSARALWYANRTLGVANESDKPPADLGTLTQQRTERVLDWLADRANQHSGALNLYSNADVGALLGFDDLTRHGRVLGNVQSRLDFACYQAGVPPLGLCVVEYFANAWSREGRRWAFPVPDMRLAAQTYNWSGSTLAKVRANARLLPGQAAIPWRKELNERETYVRRWAEGLLIPFEQAGTATIPQPVVEDLEKTERKLLTRPPMVRERVSKSIERGSIGARLKRANGFRCQICDALGLETVGFIKLNGEPYVEAHHATPVSELEIGSLSATNIMILCANHHRQMHYGNVNIERTAATFILTLDEARITIRRFGQNNG
ncbi:hypothetical protein [Sphingomonas sp. PP-CC-3A-396]|uniref:HNH endonuclease n=1 Tax=Sphingomonas sp. PP-CC-3A-396 TaxID=2135655 RepID=UPI001050F39B|nr:hypothetical protein [Sphingomonas sp. PP-CC-3A-396]TCQ05725.1 hypothetical protein C8J40_106248 [Sphingomonas sp. PP-CC-3A-396]